jgi:hypothetical protein
MITKKSIHYDILMGKPDLNPLKKWVLQNRYFIKTTDTKERKAIATHFLLDGGIWGIPKEKYSEFLGLLAIDLQNGEKHYICENRTEIFKFICDIDMFEDTVVTTEQISRVVELLNGIVSEYYGDSKVIICGADPKTVKINKTEDTGDFGLPMGENELFKSGFHLVWPDIWISVENAKRLRVRFIETLTSKFGEREKHNTWEDVVDLAVYEDNGLRMVGCRKMGICKSCKNKKEFRDTCVTCDFTGKKDENRIYSPKAVIGPCEKSYFGSICNYSVMVFETSIYNYLNCPETPMIKKCDIELKEKKKTRNAVEPKQENEMIVKIENFIHRNYKGTHSKVRITKLTKTENCFYAEPDDNFCINVNRNHTSSGVYFQVTPTGISQRCYCKKETLDGRYHGMCKHFSSPEIPLTKVLQNFLFGATVCSKNTKKNIVNMNITRNAIISSLDLSVSLSQNRFKAISMEKEVCLMNCKNILSQLENELLKKN